MGRYIVVRNKMNKLETLKNIFENENVIVEERQNIETGKVTYGLVARRMFSMWHINKIVEAGFVEEEAHRAHDGSIVAILSHNEVSA